jgi:hypothetical protein
MRKACVSPTDRLAYWQGQWRPVVADCCPSGQATRCPAGRLSSSAPWLATIFVVLGRLADPYGMQGWLRLHAFGDDPLAWAEMPVWWVGRKMVSRGANAAETPESGDANWLCCLTGVADRTAAEAHEGISGWCAARGVADDREGRVLLGRSDRAGSRQQPLKNARQGGRV